MQRVLPVPTQQLLQLQQFVGNTSNNGYPALQYNVKGSAAWQQLDFEQFCLQASNTGKTEEGSESERARKGGQKGEDMLTTPHSILNSEGVCVSVCDKKPKPRNPNGMHMPAAPPTRYPLT